MMLKGTPIEIDMTHLFPADPVVNIFEVTQSQKDKIDKWWDEIMNLHLYELGYIKEDGTQFTADEIYERVNTGAIGGSISYTFTPTSIGVILEVEESITGNTLDVTDYNTW
jgi:hypothetical protein